jgi:hypothetical protein
MSKIQNKGTGAGGANTNINGLKFEDKTSCENILNKNKFCKKILDNKSYYLEKKIGDATIIYLKQYAFQKYMKTIYNLDTYRKPDEAFIIKHDDKLYLKIVEKKNQNRDGSVEDKLKTGAFNRREYELMLNNKFIVEYVFCVSKFLQNKFISNKLKYNNMKKIMDEDKITIFFGDDSNYYSLIYEWIIKI